MWTNGGDRVVAGPGGGTPAGALTFGGRRTVDRAFGGAGRSLAGTTNASSGRFARDHRRLYRELRGGAGIPPERRPEASGRQPAADSGAGGPSDTTDRRSGASGAVLSRRRRPRRSGATPVASMADLAPGSTTTRSSGFLAAALVAAVHWRAAGVPPAAWAV